MNIDYLFNMTDEELTKYMRKESNKIIDSAPDHIKHKLRQKQWRLDSLRVKYAGNQTGLMVAIHKEMMEQFRILNEALQSLKDDLK